VAIGGSSLDPSEPGPDGHLELRPIEAVIFALG
jgi:hypothetical protein